MSTNPQADRTVQVAAKQQDLKKYATKSDEWVLAGDTLVLMEVEYPSPYEIKQQIIYYLPNISNIAAIAENIALCPPWTVTVQSDLEFTIYKHWYDEITIDIGVQPQVQVFSDTWISSPMPHHWLYTCRSV
jgi:hypothetical protein